MNHQNKRSILGDGVDCENKPAAWYDLISIDFYDEDAENGTDMNDSLNTVLINFLVPDGHVATLNISKFSVDDWGHLTIYSKNDATHKLLHLGMDEGIDGTPGERGGHTEWGKTGRVQLIPGEYVIEVEQKNATYNDKGDPRYNVSKCILTLQAEKVEALCEIAWPQSSIPLSNPITWYETRNNSAGRTCKYKTGTIDMITANEFAAMARVIYAEAGNEADQFEEMKAIASVMLNRLGNNYGDRKFYKPVLSMQTEFDKTVNEGKKFWLGYKSNQYNNVEGEKCLSIDTLSCTKLKRAAQALQYIINNGTDGYPYYFFDKSSAEPSVKIGPHYFKTEKRYATCTDLSQLTNEKGEVVAWDSLPDFE